MTGRPSGAALAIAATAVALAGCSSSDTADAPRSSDAKASLVKVNAAVKKGLSRPGLGRPSSSWQPVVKSVPDPTCDNADDGEDENRGYRWRSSAALTVTDGGTDGDAVVAGVIGSLGDAFDVASYVGDLDDDPLVLLPTTYGSGADAVSVDIIIVRAAQGWTFLVNSRTVCLTPS